MWVNPPTIVAQAAIILKLLMVVMSTLSNLGGKKKSFSFKPGCEVQLQSRLFLGVRKLLSETFGFSALMECGSVGMSRGEYLTQKQPRIRVEAAA